MQTATRGGRVWEEGEAEPSGRLGETEALYGGDGVDGRGRGVAGLGQVFYVRRRRRRATIACHIGAGSRLYVGGGVRRLPRGSLRM